MTRFLTILVLSLLLSACGGESLEDRIAAAESLPDLIVVITGREPKSSYFVESTRYLHIEFDDDKGGTIPGRLLDIKRMMPEMLNRYPEADRLFFGWKLDGVFYIKANFERSKVAHLRWDAISVHDIPSVAQEYWVHPAVK